MFLMLTVNVYINTASLFGSSLQQLMIDQDCEDHWKIFLLEK